MKKTFNYLALTSCLVLGSALAHADADSAHGGKYDNKFKAMDSNSDGKVSREEFNAFQQRNFQQLDANSDSYLSSEEVNEGKKKMKDDSRSSSSQTRGSWDSRSDRSSDSQSASGRTDRSGRSDQSSDSGRSNTSWTPQEAGASKSGSRMSDSWDKMRDDAWHKDMNSWDKTRDDAWHKTNDAHGEGASHSGQN